MFVQEFVPACTSVFVGNCSYDIKKGPCLADGVCRRLRPFPALLMVRSRKSVGHGSPTNCMQQPEAKFLNHVYTVKITQKFRPLGVPLTVNFTRASRKPTHNNGCGPSTKKWVGTRGVKNSGCVNP